MEEFDEDNVNINCSESFAVNMRLDISLANHAFCYTRLDKISRTAMEEINEALRASINLSSRAPGAEVVLLVLWCVKAFSFYSSSSVRLGEVTLSPECLYHSRYLY